MEFVLFLAFVAILIVLAYLYSQLDPLRSKLESLEDKIDDRVRGLERRLAQLETSVAAKATGHSEAATSNAAAAPAPVPPPMATTARETPQTIPQSSWTQAAPQTAAKAPDPVQTPLQPIPPSQETTPAATREQAASHPSQATPLREARPVEAPPFAALRESAKSTPEPEPKPTLSLEERLGTNWLNKLGIAILVIGLAFFLATRLKTMGPGGKVLTGLAASLLLLVGGLWLERRQTYRIFARAGIGGGWALLFFTTFAMHHFEATRILSSLVLDLLLMLLVATGMVLHSLRYRSQTVTGLAFLLAFATVATSHLESAHGTVIFSLLASAVLALGLVVVTTIRHWARLELAGLVGVMANHFLWLTLVMPVMSGKAGFPLFWQSTALILFYWALFRVAYILRVPLDRDEDQVSSLSAVVTSGGVLGLLKLQSAHPEWAFWALLALGTLEMLLGIWARTRRRSAFVVLTTIASVLLVAAVPFQFHGVSWPVLWLVEAHALALCGLRLGEPMFRRLGVLAGFAASLVLAIHDVAPLAIFRLEHPDPGHHPSLMIGLMLAAALFWLHGEVYPRRWPDATASLGELERTALTATSWLGLAAAAASLWVALPAHWIPVGWLALVFILGVAADWKSISSFALQADVLATITIPALYVWDFVDAPNGVYRLPVGIAIALFYAGMRRRTVPENSTAYVAAAYSWIASLVLFVWLAQVISDKWLVLALIFTALALFEIGRHFEKSYLRWQGMLSAVLAFFFLQRRWFDQPSWTGHAHGWMAVSWLDLTSAIAAAALAYWLQERTRSAYFATVAGHSRQMERWIGILAGVAGTFVLASWLPLLAPASSQSEQAAVPWAVLASLLLAVALLAHRGAFQLHGIGLCLWTGLYGAFATITAVHPSTLDWWQSELFQLGLASAVLLAGLAFAFRLRDICANDERWAARPALFKHPEQWFFFVPFGLMVIALAVELRSGNITLGWSLLGVGAFVFALLVGERSFRLGGLALLMLSVVKILLMDIWTLEVADRYITLIVMGCALLLVSFLYTRFRSVFLKYL